MKKPKLLCVLLLFTCLRLTYAQTPCEDGKAGNYDCSGIDLMAHISATDLMAEEEGGIWINDIWGWTDPTTQKEYALIGMSNGTSFVDITDPVNPIFLGMLPEHNFDNPGKANNNGRVYHDGAKSIWRDIKVYSNHAYIVSEDPEHGMQVFDLAELRNVASPPTTFTETGHYAGIGSAHNLVINEATGFAYAVGADSGNMTCTQGGLHIIDLSNPATPVYAGCFDDEAYTHDAQCVIYNGPDSDYEGKEICFNSNSYQNNNAVVIVDVNDKANPSLISRTDYNNSQYTHQGWLTEDHKYFITNDELDELNFGTNTKTFIWNVQDLDNPVLIGTYEHAGKSIDHNLYIVDKYVYESNYTSGLRILDLSDVENGNLTEVGYFDTYVSDNGTTFNGSWSNYPFFPSGNIIISDITNGLFIVRPQDVSIATHPQDVVSCVGQHLDIPIAVLGENLTFQWQINEGDGFKDIDNFERYNNTTTTVMHAHTLEAIQDGLQFRCIVTDQFDEQYISEAMTLSVGDIPTSGFDYSIDSYLGDVTFTNTSTNADDYSWDFGDESVADITEQPSHRFDESGVYEVVLSATNYCGTHTTTKSIDLIVTSTTSSSIASKIKIFPMPATSEVTILLNGNTNNFQLVVFGANGQALAEHEVKGKELILDVSAYNKGVYYLNITNKDQSSVKKLIIQ